MFGLNCVMDFFPQSMPSVWVKLCNGFFIFLFFKVSVGVYVYVCVFDCFDDVRMLAATLTTAV